VLSRRGNPPHACWRGETLCAAAALEYSGQVRFKRLTQKRRQGPESQRPEKPEGKISLPACLLAFLRRCASASFYKAHFFEAVIMRLEKSIAAWNKSLRTCLNCEFWRADLALTRLTPGRAKFTPFFVGGYWGARS